MTSPTAGKDAEKVEHSYTHSRDEKWPFQSRKEFDSFPWNLLCNYQRIQQFTLRHLSQRNKNLYSHKACIEMFTAASSLIAKNAYTYCGRSSSWNKNCNKKEWIIDTCNSLHEFPENSDEWKELLSKGNIL